MGNSMTAAVPFTQSEDLDPKWGQSRHGWIQRIQAGRLDDEGFQSREVGNPNWRAWLSAVFSVVQEPHGS